MEEIQKEERERVKGIIKYARNPKEQRYWEIYWANKNLLPAAIRELYGKRRFMEFKDAERKAAAKFDPEMTERVAEGEYLEGPEDWIKSWYRRWTVPEIDGGAFAFGNKNEENEFRFEKEVDAGHAISFIRNKYFGKRFEGEKHSRIIEETLGKSMYGIDMHLVDLVRMARALRYLLELKEMKSKRYKDEDIQKALDNLAWQIAMAKKADEALDIDVLELSGESWEKTKHYQKLAAAGPRALMDGLGVFDMAILNKLREDRRFYKKAEVAKAFAHIQLEKILEMLGRSFKKDEENKKVTAVATTVESPYHTVARTLHDELRKIAEEKGKEHIGPKDVNEAMRRATRRLRAEGLLKSVKTPALAEAAIMAEVARFYEEYIKRFGRPPIILDEEDAKEVLRHMEDYFERLVAHGPKHYFKGYVLGQLRKLKV